MALFKTKTNEATLRHKQAMREFGRVRAFAVACLVLNIIGLVHILLEFVTSNVLYGIPQYVLFAVLVTLLCSPASWPRQEIPSPRQSLSMFFKVGLVFVILQMVLTYLAEYLWFGGYKSSSMDIILAVLLMRFTPGFIEAIHPGYESSRKGRGLVARWGLVALSVTAALPFLAFWGVGHVLSSAVLATLADTSQVLGFAVPSALFLMLFYQVWRNHVANTPGHNFTVLGVGLIASLGLANGITTGSPIEVTSSFTDRTSMQIILYSIFVMECIAVLTLWYYLIILPRFSKSATTQTPAIGQTKENAALQ